jgi:hypothetical protein
MRSAKGRQLKRSGLNRESGNTPGQEEPELLSTALPIEIFGDTGALALRLLSQAASRLGNGAKEPEHQGFLRSPDHLMAADAASSGIDPEADIAFASLWTEANNAIRRQRCLLLALSRHRFRR